MNLMIQSAEDMYRAFLRGIRKDNTTVIKPAYWNPFINKIVIEWVQSKLPLMEFSQKRIDDLGMLRVVTDGESLVNSYQPIPETIQGTDVYSLPVTYTQLSNAQLFSGDYPLYLHGINAMFRLPVNDNDWVEARIRKSDKTVMMSNNPFRRPSETRIYFERIGSEIRKVGGNGENTMRLEYIRYPKIIQYSSTDPWDPEFPTAQCGEIVELAIRRYLEQVQDPRYRTFLQEQMIQSQNS